MSSKRTLYHALNIEQGEELQVFLLLLQTVFLGVFLALFDISATALFTNVFGEEILSRAFLVSGIIGFLLTAQYSRLQNRIRFSRLIVYNLIFIFIVTSLLRYFFVFSQGKWLVFIVFIMMGPLNLLGVVGFWGMASRLFSLRQGKRLFGLIDSGQVAGMIIISLMVPVLIRWVDNTMNLLTIASGSVLVALLLQVIIVNRYNLDTQNIQVKGKKEKVSFSILKIPYVRAISLYVVLSMISAFFIFFLFLTVTKSKYHGEEEFASFLGMFTASLMIFSLLVKTFIYSKLTKTYGLKVTLVLPPFLQGIFTVLAIVVGLVFGYTTASATFMLFFLLVSLSRLFSVSMKSAIEVPSQKILYQSLDKSIRYRAQVMIDGMVNEMAAILSGLILLIVSLFSFITIIHYAYILCAIVIAWIFTAISVYREYRKSLESSLVKLKSEDKRESQEGVLLSKKVKEPGLSADEVIYYLSLIEIFEPLQVESLAKDFSIHTDERVRNYMSSFNKPIHALQGKEGVGNKYISNKELYKLVYSAEPEEREEAARIIHDSPNDDYLAFLVVLLRDLFPEVRIKAIKAASAYPKQEICLVLLDMLTSEKYSNYAYQSLTMLGDSVVDSIEQSFYKSGLDENTHVRMVKLLGMNPAEKTSRYLLNKVTFHNRRVKREIYKALVLVDFKIKNEEESRLFKNELEENLRVHAWNLNVFINLTEDNELKVAMKKEMGLSLDMLFLNLSLLYDPTTIAFIRDTLLGETSESLGYALELMDLFVEEDIKPRLFPVLEDISDAERVKRLQDHFPLRKLESIEILFALINRDPNQLSPWVKALAIDALKNQPLQDIPFDIIAQLFNPDKMLRELASQVVSELDGRVYHSVSQRLSSQSHAEMERINLGFDWSVYQVIQTIKVVSPFSYMKEKELIKLVSEAETINIDAHKPVIADPASIYFVVQGSVSFQEQNNNREFQESELINLLQWKEQKKQFVLLSREPGQMIRFSMEKISSLYEFTTDHSFLFIEKK